MTPQDYETERNELKAIDDAKRGVPPLCPDHHHPMIMMYGGGWDYDRYLCGVRGCTHEVELETSTLPEENK